jgi:hypothetical protein
MRDRISNIPNQPILHQPFWCEENIWHLAQHTATTAVDSLVLVLTGAQAQVACWNQKAGDDSDAILWDYHVVLATYSGGWQIRDLDSRLGYPVTAAEWLRGTFPCPDLVSQPYQPRCALIPAEDFVREFGSNRAHMLNIDGSWQQRPPPWPMIAGRGLGLIDVIQQARQGLDLVAVQARLT